MKRILLPIVLGLITQAAADAQPSNLPNWKHLSSKTGDLPVPSTSTEQTGALVEDFDKDGVNDFILSFRQKAPALLFYRHTDKGWDRYVIDKDFLTVEAGGAVCDIDGDGDLDVVFGGDWQSNEVWWWENPYPKYDPNVPWKRHVIKKGGATQHHDQVFGDFLGTGKPQLAFWNQGAKTIFLAEIPDDPRHAESWKLIPIFTGIAGSQNRENGFKYPEGMSAFDIDGDGKVDLLAGNMWFKHMGGNEFKAVQIAEVGGLIFAGYFKPGKYPQIVISPGDSAGPLCWYECNGSPLESTNWVGHILVDHVIHGHSLQLGDINRDGYLDIFCAEMAKWTESQAAPDNPNATAWIFYGDGQGHFTKTEMIKGQGWHETRLRDLNNDGNLDLLNKPYNWEAPRVDVWLNNSTRPGAKGAGTSSSFHGPMGLQLYSLRDIFSTNVPLGLQFTRNFGFVEVELAGTYKLPEPQFRSMLEQNHLKPVSALVDYSLFVKDISGVAKMAKAMGVEFVGCAWIPHNGKFDAKTAREAVDVFNRAGEALAKEGLTFVYHNHGYEFEPYKDGTLFDLLATETKPEFVSFEMDIFWTVFPAQDPVALLKKYAGRWKLMHVKDIRKGVPLGSLSGGTDVTNDVAIGTGQINIPAVMRTAQEVGVKHYFIEDESPVPTKQLPESLHYLESLSW